MVLLDEDGQKIKSTYHVGNKPVDYKNLLKKTEISLFDSYV